MKDKINFALFIFLLLFQFSFLTCKKDVNKIDENNDVIIELNNDDISNIVKNISNILEDTAEDIAAGVFKLNYKTINEKLNMNIPEIGEYLYLQLYQYNHLEFAKIRSFGQEADGFGYEEIETRLKNSYLVFRLTPGYSWEEAVIFDSRGIISIVPEFGDGHEYGKFIVLGKFENDFNDIYDNSREGSLPPSDNSIVTFHNHAASYASENGNPYAYKFYVYFSKIE